MQLEGLQNLYSSVRSRPAPPKYLFWNQYFRNLRKDDQDMPLLRVYWYDGTSTGPMAQHLTLAHLQDVKG